MNKAVIRISNCRNCIFCQYEHNFFDSYFVCNAVEGRPCCLKYTNRNSNEPIIQKFEGQEQVNIPNWCPNLYIQRKEN